MKHIVRWAVLLGCLVGGCMTGGEMCRTVAVMDETGKVVEGAKVLAMAKGYREQAVTDASGAARMRWTEGAVSLVVRAEWHDPAQVQSTTNRLVKVVLFRSRP